MGCFTNFEMKQLALTVGCDLENLRDSKRRKQYHGEVKTDRYGRQIPKHAHGTANLDKYTASSSTCPTPPLPGIPVCP